MNMRIVALVAGIMLIAAGSGLLYFDREQFAWKNIGYIIWGVGLILANWNAENKSLTKAGTVLTIIGPLILVLSLVLRGF